MSEDRVGKLFIRIFTNGDLRTNPMSLGECLVCGGVFTRDESRKHSEVPCQPSPVQPFASARMSASGVRPVSLRSPSFSGINQSGS